MTTSELHCTIRSTCSACCGAGLKRILAPISILHPDSYIGLSDLVIVRPRRYSDTIIRPLRQTGSRGTVVLENRNS